MRSFLRLIGLFSLIALVINAPALFAQEDTITVVGSGIAAPIIEAAADASGTDISMNVTGTDRGLEAFCQGEADIALATRGLSAEEEFNCTGLGIQFLELLAGYNAIAFISSPDSSFNQCLSTDELHTLFAPSAQGQTTDWSQVNVENPSAPVSLFIPSVSTPAYAALDGLVEGVGIRSDVQMSVSDDETLSAVVADPNALGVVSYTNAASAGDTIRILQLNTNTAGCVTPSQETLEGREYGGAERLFSYVNSASLSKPGMTELLNAAFSQSAQPIVEGLDFVAPSADTYAINQQIISEAQTGRRFSRDVNAFVIPTGLIGEINIGGSPQGSGYLQAITSAFTAQQPSVVINQTYLGEPDGFRRLCNGELDIAAAFSELSSEQADNCAANNVTPYLVELGSHAVVLLANADSDYLSCLTTEQLASIWSATSAETMTTWNQVSPDFPDTPMTLFAPDAGSFYSDLLLLGTTDSSIPTRVDIQLNDDPAYRAAATANVEGALTFMSFPEEEAVHASGQENVVPVAVDGGNGCIEPTEATISDGTYPLARPLNLIVKRSSLARPEVQSLLWFMFSDENYSSLTNDGLIGMDFADLPDLRFALQETFTQVQAEAAAIVPESTTEATVEATEAADSATEEATPEVSESTPTEEATAEATEAAG